MGDYAFGGGEEESVELKKLNSEVLGNPDDFETWEKLVRAAESQEGGLNRNSSPVAISSARDVYDRLLAKYPLFFGYWKKYADLEFAIAGTEAAELIYERGVASVSPSVDLWVNYCAFKVETTHDDDRVRDLFERAANSVGLDFLAHPFWDKYLEFEEHSGTGENIFAILSRIVHYPLHQYARYFERYRTLASSRPITDLAPADVLSRIQDEVNRDLGLGGNKHSPEVERELRMRLDQYHLELFQQTQTETTKRWTYEQEIKRPYFHVTELDDAQLENWQKYLDFEEAEGDYQRITFLYERCLVTCAQYDDFWLRYARWMYAQGEDRREEVRNIYARASCVYVPIAEPKVRHQYALFEETCSRIDVASAIYDGTLFALPGDFVTIVAWANLEYRHHGYGAAAEVFQKHLDSSECSPDVKGALTTDLALLAMRDCHSDETIAKARKVFQEQQQWYLESQPYWAGYLVFECRLPSNPDQVKRVKQVHDSIRRRSRLATEQIKELSQQYLDYLPQHGGKGAAKEYLDLDAQINGPASIANAANGSTK